MHVQDFRAPAAASDFSLVIKQSLTPIDVFACLVGERATKHAVMLESLHDMGKTVHFSFEGAEIFTLPDRVEEDGLPIRQKTGIRVQ